MQTYYFFYFILCWFQCPLWTKAAVLKRYWTFVLEESKRNTKLIFSDKEINGYICISIWGYKNLIIINNNMMTVRWHTVIFLLLFSDSAPVSTITTKYSINNTIIQLSFWLMYYSKWNIAWKKCKHRLFRGETDPGYRNLW